MNDIIPEPTITIINTENSHAHYLYEIDNPVMLPLLNSTIKISWKAINYYKAVQYGFQTKLNADRGFVGYLIKNPFSSKWRTWWSDRIYNLDYLAEFVELPNIYNVIEEDNSIEGRHMRMFHACRKISYKLANDYDNYKEYFDVVKTCCLNYYKEKIIQTNNFVDFPKSEAISIAQSIAQWIWKRKGNKNFKNFCRNKGVMHFSKLKHDKNGKSSPEEVINRKSSGAFYTHSIRKSSTINKIVEAKNRLIISGEEITVKRLIEESGMSKSTIYRYKNSI